MFGVAKDELHGQNWDYNKGGYFFHSYNIHPYYEGNYIENFHVEGYNSLNYVIKNLVPDFSSALTIIAGGALAIGGAIKLFSNLKK